MRLGLSAKASGCRLVLDNCDNQFSATTNTVEWQSSLNRLRALARVADEIVCCSDDLVAAMRSNVETDARWSVIEDPAEDKVEYPGDIWLKTMLSPAANKARLRAWRHAALVAADRREGRTPLVWFGSHGNAFAEGGMSDLAATQELLEQVNRRHPISLSVISNSQQKFESLFAGARLPMHYLDWDKVTFINSLRQHDIALLPASLNEFTRSKSSNRVVQSLRHGLAVMADAIPSYRRFSNVIRIDDWWDGMCWLLAHPAERDALVQRGQTIVEQTNSLGVIASDWERVLFRAPDIARP